MPQYSTTTTISIVSSSTLSSILHSEMAASGFEGFEKRLELRFFGDCPLGLRRLSPAALDQVMRAVECEVVSAVGNRFFDSYVLSESSLFVYPDRIIIKTCGTTRLLRSVPLLLRHATAAGLHPASCIYTRGAFLFPDAQPFPHASFDDEVLYLDAHLPPSLRHRKARVLSASPAHSWHVYSATDGAPARGFITVEVCMTELDRAAAGKFFRPPGDKTSPHDAAGVMTRAAGVGAILPRALVCDHAFEPCGYSMNGLNRARYSTIHVTPEDGFSYASFEYVANGEREISKVLGKVAAVFRPGVMSVSISVDSGSNATKPSLATNALKRAGMCCLGRAAEEFPGGGVVTYQTFSARRK